MLVLPQYAPWQPISTDKATLGTKAPYYGSIAVAATLGSGPVTVREIPLSSQIDSEDLQPEAAYAIYTEGTLWPSPCTLLLFLVVFFKYF